MTCMTTIYSNILKCTIKYNVTQHTVQEIIK